MDPLEKHLADARNVLGIVQLRTEFALEALDDNPQQARDDLNCVLTRIAEFLREYPKAR